MAQFIPPTLSLLHVLLIFTSFDPFWHEWWQYELCLDSWVHCSSRDGHVPWLPICA